MGCALYAITMRGYIVSDSNQNKAGGQNCLDLGLNSSLFRMTDTVAMGKKIC